MTPTLSPGRFFLVVTAGALLLQHHARYRNACKASPVPADSIEYYRGGPAAWVEDGMDLLADDGMDASRCHGALVKYSRHHVLNAREAGTVRSVVDRLGEPDTYQGGGGQRMTGVYGTPAAIPPGASWDHVYGDSYGTDGS